MEGNHHPYGHIPIAQAIHADFQANSEEDRFFPLCITRKGILCQINKYVWPHRTQQLYEASKFSFRICTSIWISLHFYSLVKMEMSRKQISLKQQCCNAIKGEVFCVLPWLLYFLLAFVFLSTVLGFSSKQSKLRKRAPHHSDSYTVLVNFQVEYSVFRLKVNL